MAKKNKEESVVNVSKRALALEIAKKINGMHKDNPTVVMTGDTVVECNRVSTGSFGLDLITGGGFPEGRIIEMFGPESSGKTTIAMLGMIQYQKKYPDSVVAIVDVEHAFGLDYFVKLGLDREGFLLSQPDNAEQALSIVEEMVENGVGYIILDSIAGLAPKKEVEGDMGDQSVGVVAKLMSQAMRKLAGIVNKNNCILIFINQLREKIGVFYGSNEYTTGGNAMKYFSSLRLDIRKKAFITFNPQLEKKNDKDPSSKVNIGHYALIKTVKNKTSFPYKICEVPIMYGEGYDYVSEVFDMAVRTGVITRGGAWYSFGDVKLGQGEENCLAILRDNHEMVEEIERLTLEQYEKLGL